MQRGLTTTGFWELRETQESIITWDGLKGDVTVPLSARSLLACVSVLVQLLPTSGADHTDFIIFDAVLSTRVCHRVDM